MTSQEPRPEHRDLAALTILSRCRWPRPDLAGWRVGAWKGRVVLGILLGVFLGWLSVIITACAEDPRAQSC